MNSISIFDNEEMVILNHLAIGVAKDKVLTSLNFNTKISTDDNMIEIINELKNKVVTMSNEEWEKLQDMLPFTTQYNDEDVEDIVIQELNTAI